MRLQEELLVWGPVLGLISLLPVCYWRKAAQRQWISIYSVALSKEWHKQNKASVAHLRSQARADIMRVFQQDGAQSLPLQPLDDLSSKLTAMEDTMEDTVRPVWTPWLCILVFLEMMQYLAVPFASKIHWDTESDWRILSDVFGRFLPNPDDRRVYDLTTWIILTPLYAAAFCVVWIAIFGSCIRFLPWTRSAYVQDYLGNILVKMLLIGRRLLISSKETFFDFGTLFILTGIIRSIFNQEGRLECYWPTSLLILVLFFGVLLWSDEVVNSVNWMYRVVRFFFLNRVPHLFDKLPKNDHLYYQTLMDSPPGDLEVQELHLQFPCHQRPTFSSRWIFLSGTSKLVISVLFVLAHFEEFWAWMLLSVSTVLFLLQLRESVKYGPCTFQWVNVFRNIALVSALWGNLCAFLAQGLHAYPGVTYAFTPSIMFLVGLCIILGGAPLCVLASQRLFTCSPVRLHPLKLQVIHAYFKFVALGRILSVKNSLSSDGDVVFGTELNALLQNAGFSRLCSDERNSSINKLLINHELWVVWIRKNSQCFKFSPIELSMQEKINVCSKKSLATCIPPSEACTELQAIQEIKHWMRQAESVDPNRDIELGLRVPYDEYLSFTDGPPVFTGDSGARVFDERCLRKLNVVLDTAHNFSATAKAQSDLERVQSCSDQQQQSPSGSSASPLRTYGSHIFLQSTGSNRSIRQPCQTEPGERPNQISSIQETASDLSLDTPRSKHIPPS